MIRSEELKFQYKLQEDKDVVAVDNISVQVSEGEFVVVIGHNGSGKSTFAKMINAILLPSGGKIYIDGMDSAEEKNLWDIRKTAGMVFQNPDNQIVATIVEEDVAFGPENIGVPTEEIRTRVDHALETVDMEQFKRKPPHMLSGGQKQRIAIAGVLAMRPKCIVLDEPTAMLDPNGRKDVIRTIEKLNREEGITIVHITHFMDEAVNADRVIVIDKGKVVLEGKPKQVFSQVETLKGLGLDVPQVTMLAHELREAGINISGEIINVEEMVDELCQLL